MDLSALPPRRKAAILMLRLGTEHAAPLLRSLRRNELTAIGEEVASLGRVAGADRAGLGADPVEQPDPATVGS